MSDIDAVRLHIDGGARGNPGPAAAGIVITDPESGIALREAGYFLGKATNNVAEYQGLIHGLRDAKALGARRVACFSDSELLVRQMTGQYRVKNAGLKPLFREALQRAGEFEEFSIDHVRRDENIEADRLANMALDSEANVE